MTDHIAKYFGLNNLSIETAIRSAEKSLAISLRDRQAVEEIDDKKEDIYYPQFSEGLRSEAERMAKNYVLFYSLENAIRDLIVEVLADAHGPDWWKVKGVVPETMAGNAEKNRKKEESSSFTLRSDRMIDYTNFGELGEIIKVNWNIFGAIFRDIRAVEQVISRLNALRASIAHCTALSEDEELRLHLSVRDWFRQQS